MGAHSKLSPSNAHRWMNCPGSVALCEKAPPEKPSVYAEEGTKAHSCLEFVLQSFIKKKSLSGAVKKANEKFGDEMASHAAKSVDIIRSMKPQGPAQLFCEERVNLTHVIPNGFGTLDAAWVQEFGDLVAIDYKYGAGVAVSPQEENGEPNPQLMLYAVGVARRHEYNFEKVVLAVIQPRIWTAEETGGLVSAEFPFEVLEEFEAKTVKAVKATQEKMAYLNAGSWCKFCPAASFCPEISTNALERSGVVFDLEKGIQATPEPKALTVESLSKILPACDLLENWIHEVRSQAYTLADRGEKIPGYKLVNKRANRVWTQGAEEKAKELFGEKVFAPPSFLSPAQLEKAIGKKGKDFTAEYTASVSSGTSLVAESDRRPEVSPMVFEFEHEESQKSQKKE
jgi:hypothetical protein